MLSILAPRIDLHLVSDLTLYGTVQTLTAHDILHKQVSG